MKNNLINNPAYDGYDGMNELADYKPASFVDEPIKADDTLSIPEYVPLSAGWHEIEIKALFTRRFDNGKEALTLKFTLCEDETQTERTQSIFSKATLSSLRGAKNQKKAAKAKNYLGMVWALFANYTPENQSMAREQKTYTNIIYFADHEPEQ